MVFVRAPLLSLRCGVVFVACAVSFSPGSWLAAGAPFALLVEGFALVLARPALRGRVHRTCCVVCAAPGCWLGVAGAPFALLAAGGVRARPCCRACDAGRVRRVLCVGCAAPGCWLGVAGAPFALLARLGAFALVWNNCSSFKTIWDPQTNIKTKNKTKNCQAVPGRVF